MVVVSSTAAAEVASAHWHSRVGFAPTTMRVRLGPLEVGSQRPFRTPRSQRKNPINSAAFMPTNIVGRRRPRGTGARRGSSATSADSM